MTDNGRPVQGRDRPGDDCAARRVPVTLLHEMRRRNAKQGLTSLCIGGRMGVAMAIERYTVGARGPSAPAYPSISRAFTGEDTTCQRAVRTTRS